MQLTYLDTTKLYQSCCRVQSPFTVCSAHEIELKKNSRLISEAPWRALVLLSKDVVEKLWSFVKAYGYENRSRYLVRYVILYSVTLTTLFTLVLFFWCRFGCFEISKKVGNSVYPLKRSAVFTPSKLGCVYQN